jgi:hypothetical protein
VVVVVVSILVEAAGRAVIARVLLHNFLLVLHIQLPLVLAAQLPLHLEIHPEILETILYLHQ